MRVTPNTGQPKPISYNPYRGELNGTYIWSSGVLEQRTEKSTAGSPAVYYRFSGFGKLEL
jgi:hypothetical protein